MSTVIKAGQPFRAASADTARGVAFSFEDMTRRAEQYTADIRAQAAKIIGDAQQQAEQIRSNAQQQGEQAAKQNMEKMVEQKAAERVRTLMPALKQAATELQGHKQEWLAYWQQNVVQLATAIAARVIRRELKQAPEITLDWISEALELAAGSGQITLRLHPQDAQALGDNLAQLTAAVGSLAKINVVSDPHITAGGCRVETKFGAIDQQVEAQLKRIEQELT